MALWDSGLWDAALWSTEEATIAITLDGITFTAAGQDVHSGNITVTLGDITATASGTVTHTGSASIALADVVPAMAGNITRHATLDITLDDITDSETGYVEHVGTLTAQLADIAVDINGAINPDNYWGKTGGIGKKKKIKNERAEIEKAVEKAVNKALGIEEESPQVEAQEVIAEQPVIDYSAIINELALDAQAKALNMTIEQYLIDAENDDEEAILLFL
jgi:hypothetical protein